jgi:hypothetical protein
MGRGPESYQLHQLGKTSTATNLLPRNLESYTSPCSVCRRMYYSDFNVQLRPLTTQ